MAPYSFDLLDQQKQDKQNDNQPVISGGGQTFMGGSGAQTTAPPKTTNSNTTNGSGFVGLDQYMKANQGQNFGNTLAGKVQGTINQGSSDLDKGAQTFTDQSNAGSTHWNDIQGQAQSIVNGAGDNTSATDYSNFANWSSGQYHGPENFNDIEAGKKAESSVNKAGREAGAFNTEQGRYGLLDEYFGRPTYSTGEKSLDNALVGASKGVGARGQFMGNEASQLSAKAGQTNQDMANLVQQNKAATAEAGKQASALAQNAQSTFGNQLKTNFDNYTKNALAQNTAFENDIKNHTLTDDDLKRMGLTNGEQVWGSDLSKYIGAATPATLGTFATDADYAKYLALSQLAGVAPSELNAADRAKAGTANPYDSYNKQQLSDDLSNKNKAYQDDLNSSLAPLISKQNDLSKHYAMEVGAMHNGDVSAYQKASDDWKQLQDLNNQIQKTRTDKMNQYNSRDRVYSVSGKKGK